MPISVSVTHKGDRSIAAVTVEQDGRTTQHTVTVAEADLRRYGASEVEELVRRAFAFLLEREPNTSILREFRITEIERYFSDFASVIRS